MVMVAVKRVGGVAVAVTAFASTSDSAVSAHILSAKGS